MPEHRHLTAVVRPARPADRPAVERLLRAAALPTAGLDDQFSEFMVATTADGVVGVAGVERYGAFGLLRSVVVDDAARGRGLGQLLTMRVLDRANTAGVSQVFLLTTTAAPYFARFGFRPTTREAIPADVRASAELQGACPESAIVMERRLPLGPPTA
jgi:N-acetylglutamate synthase-like GNAT family acetyltransferase